MIYPVEATPFVGTDAYEVTSGERVIHLLNYDNDDGKQAGPLKVRLRGDLAVPRAELVSPDTAPEARTLHADGGAFVIDSLETYALLVLPPTG